MKYSRKFARKTNAFEALGKAKNPVTPSARPIDLSQVKVASLYQYVTDGVLIGRSNDEVINLINL